MAPKKNYTPEQMGKALDAVRMGEKISTAALRFGVPRITLHNKVTGKSPAVCAMGPQTILTAEEEDILVKWLVAMSEKHFPINRQLLTESVQKIISDQGKATPFTDNKPGKKWFSSFLKRHPDITEKTAQNLSKSRDDVTEEGIRRWFDEITTYIEGKGLKYVLDEPSRIFNTDESAFFLSPKAGRVLCKQAEKHLYQFCGDEKDNITVLLTANATGQLAPPMIVFKYERLPAHITASVPEHWGIGKSESGWMCGSTFYEYVTNIFNPWLEEQKIPKPVLFFLDGHRSHLTLHLSDFCSANGIELIALYPNSTHILQPMDLAVFRPLKVAWRKEVSKWQMNNLGKVLKKDNFAPVLKDAINTISEECIRNGFRAGGLHPFGPDYIDMSKIKKKHTQIIEKEMDPKQIEFVKYLEAEIVAVYSRQKLDLFNALYLKDRSTVEQNIPSEDESLFVIWAKNKQESFNSDRSIPQIDSVDNQLPTSKVAPDNTASEVQHPNSTAILTTEDSLLLESQKTSSSEPCRDSLASPTISVLPDHMKDPQYEQTNQISVENQELSCSTPPTYHQTQIFPINQASTNQTPELFPRTNNTGSRSVTPESASETTVRVPVTPLKHPLEAALGIMVPSPFKKSLFWPEEPKDKKKKKEKVPFAVTSKSWQEYHRKKEIEKQNLQQEKEKRARERQQKKILKEKSIAEKKGKTKSKPKSKHREDTSSEDTDAEVVYAESDDSVLSKSDEKKEKSQGPQPSKRCKTPFSKQGTKSSKRPRKNLECNKSYTASDDEPLSSLTANTNSDLVVAKGQFVIVKYEGEYFPGKIEDVDHNQYEVSTMILSTGNSFRWPDKPDKIWYNAGDVVELINTPLPLNNRGFYKIKEMEKYLPNIYISSYQIIVASYGSQ